MSPSAKAKASAHFESLSRCTEVLLREIGWKGDSLFLHEYFGKKKGEDLDAILNGLSHMNYKSERLRVPLDQIDAKLLPCMYIPDSGTPFVLLDHFEDEKRFKVYDPKADLHVHVEAFSDPGTALVIKAPVELDKTLHDPQASWFSQVLKRFRKHITYALFVSFLLSLTSLAMPFFVNMIFKKITTEQITTDFEVLAYGLGLYLLSSFLFYLVRARVQSVISARMGFLVINEVMRRILFLPTGFTENAPINAQLGRIKDFESVKEFFAGPAMTALLDIPFVLILLGGLAWIDPVLAAIPSVSILAFAGMAFSIKRYVRVTNLGASQAMKDMQDFVVDSVGNLKSIRDLGYTERWINEFRDLSSRSILATKDSSDVTALILNLAQGISGFAGLLTMTIGVFRIFDGYLQPSSLMAAMLLTWRILSPMKTGFSLFTQVDRLRKSIDQLDRLMTLNYETNDFTTHKTFTRLQGHVQVSQVSLRYGRETNPALLGVSFDANPGETIVILGNGGAGKSSLLKLVMAMYLPQTGHVAIDGKSTRQIDAIALRKAIAYMPASVTFLSGTLKDHIDMVKPGAKAHTIAEAFAATGLTQEIQKLPQGLLTKFSNKNRHFFPPSFMRRFSLALVLMKNSGLWILDNPGLDLEEVHEKELMASIAAAKGKATIIIATQNPHYASLADRVLIMNNGRSVTFGTPDELSASKPPI